MSTQSVSWARVVLLLSLVLASCDQDEDPNPTVTHLAVAPKSDQVSLPKAVRIDPEPLLTADENSEKALGITLKRFKDAADTDGAECATEGEVISASPEIIPNNTSVMTDQPWLVVTHYLLKVKKVWSRQGIQPFDNFWVMGGIMPADTPSIYPRGATYSFEQYGICQCV